MPATAKKKKISVKYWNSLRPFEQKYIESRVAVDDIPTLKQRISEARKQHPDYTAITGIGYITTPNGEFVYSGSDTRRYSRI